MMPVQLRQMSTKHSAQPMNEKAVIFGATQSLIGVVTEPQNATSPKTAVLLLNAGILHRVGPNRLYVQIARTLARSGLLAMRFDFSGLGDSGVRQDNLQFERAAVSETVEAMDLLRDTYGVESFLLIGLCSGADLAFRTAAVDERVRGLGLIDFYYQPTLGYYLRCYRGKLLKGMSWRRLIGGRSSFLEQLRGTLGRFTRVKKVNQIRTIPEKTDAIDTLRALAARDADVFFVFSARGPAHYHYQRSFEKPSKSLFAESRLRAQVVDETDHVFTPLASQETLVSSMQAWAEHVVGRSNGSHSG